MHISIHPGVAIATEYTGVLEPSSWASVVIDGPTSARHWANVSCLLGRAMSEGRSLKSQVKRDMEKTIILNVLLFHI